MTEVVFHIKRLETLAAKCGVAKAEDKKPEIDTTGMSQFQIAQFKLATEMKAVREDISELDGLPENASATRKAQLSNQVKRKINEIKRSTADAKKLGEKENRPRDEIAQLVGHVKKTEELYKNRFLRQEDREALSGIRSGAGGAHQSVSDMEMRDMSKPMVSLRDDEEFQMFFQQTQLNNQKMEEALDRISAGVQRLGERAVDMKNELEVQNQLLDQTEGKVEHINTQLVGLNKKLKDTIKEIDKDKMCLYAFCCLLLLGLAGGCYYVITKKDD